MERNPEKFFHEIEQLRPWNKNHDYLPPAGDRMRHFPRILMEVIELFGPLVNTLLSDGDDLEKQLEKWWDSAVWIDMDEKFDQVYKLYKDKLSRTGGRDYFPYARHEVYKYLDDEDAEAYFKGRNRHPGPSGL